MSGLKILIIYLVISLALVGGLISYHETIHSLINQNVGKCNSTITTANACGILAVPSDCQPLTENERLLFLEMNSMNEIIGYNILWVVLAILSAGFLVALAIDRKNIFDSGTKHYKSPKQKHEFDKPQPILPRPIDRRGPPTPGAIPSDKIVYDRDRGVYLMATTKTGGPNGSGDQEEKDQASEEH